MGAPKQKWTTEEEAALKAGVIKHGAGKWRTILKDPEFSGVLYLRSNVDLKDKWRNMSVMANGWGSREVPKITSKRLNNVAKQDETSMTVNNAVKSDEEIPDVKPPTIYNIPVQPAGPKRTTVKLDNLIMEAITTLREPGGSNKTAIAAYIEEQYWPPNDFRRILSAKLKHLTSIGKLIKIKRRYSIPPTSVSSDKRRNFPMMLPEGRQRISPRLEREEYNVPTTKNQVDLELAKMKSMTPQEAALAAARAVKEAEAAMALAEEAAREAELAEAHAEAQEALEEEAYKTLRRNNTPAQEALEEEAYKTLRRNNTPKMMIHA